MNIVLKVIGRYALALAGSGCAVFLRWLLIPLVGNDTPYLVFYPAILIIAYVLGPGPGVLAMLLGIAGTDYWLIPPIYELNFSLHLLGQTVIVVSCSLFIVAFARQLNQEKKKAQTRARELDESQMLLAAIMESTPDPVFIKDRTSRMLMANPAALTAIGKPAEAILGKKDSDFFDDPAVGGAMMANDRKVMEQGRSEVIEERISGPAGDRIFLSTKTPYRDASGAILGTIGIAHDITERQQWEQQLREKQEILRLFVKHTPAAVAMFDRTMRYMLFSDRWLTDYSLGEQDLTGRSHYETFPEIGDEWKTIHQRCLQGAAEKKEEDRFTRPDGRVQWLRWEIYPWRKGDGQIGGIVMFTEDITARKQAEAALRNSEERYRSLVEQSPDAIWINRNNRITYLNPAGLKLLGVSRADQILGQSVFNFISPGSQPIVKERIRKVQTGEATPLTEISIVRIDGAEQSVEVAASPFTDQEGLAIQVTLRDITERKQAEAVRVRYQLISQYARDPLLLSAMDGTIMEANRAAEEFYGYTREELLHLPIHALRFKALSSQDDEELFLHQIKRVRSQGALFESVHKRKDGTPVPVEVSGREVTVEGQEMLLSVIRDITRRKQTEARLKQLLESSQRHASEVDAIIEAIPHAVYFGDQNGITRCNTVALRMLGASCREEMQERLAEFGHQFKVRYRQGGGEVEPKNLPFFRALRGENAQLDTWMTPEGGKEVLIRTYAAPVRVGDKIVGVVAIGIDITEHYKTEEALQEVSRRKDEFLAMLAHELRNPLAPIRNAVHLLHYGGGDALQRQREVIDRQVTHMARLLDDLLDVSRITRGVITLRKQPVMVGEMMARALEIANPLIVARQHHLHLASPPAGLQVEGDPDRLAQIVGNLLTNAAKYTNEGGSIWLEAAREGAEAIIRVRDSGIGIPPEMLDGIFNLFTQANRALDRSQGGLGIGLTLVRSLVQLHGGSVEAHSRGLGQGSEFVVRLPALSAIASAANPAAAQNGGWIPTHRVLIVDDVPDTVESLAEVLRHWGQTICTAKDGWTAVEAAGAFKPDVILLDIGLPGLDGFEVAKKIRKDLDGAMTIIAMSGYGQASDQLKAKNSGMDHYLIKPVDLKRLKNLLERKAPPG